jgi:hypothetical protein
MASHGPRITISADVITLEHVASVLGLPSDQLLELDRRAVRLAFVRGSYTTVVARNRADGSTIELTLDDTSGEIVEAAQLRQQDRELAAKIGSRMSEDLRDLVLRHPELPAIRVAVTRADDPRPTTHVVSAREVVGLAQQSEIVWIALLEEPEVRDTFPYV